MTNKEIAHQFTLVSKLMDIHQKDSVKAKSFSSTAFTIDRYPTPLVDLPHESISSIRGIGVNMAKLVIELLDTNELSLLNEIIESTPAGILELMSIKGIGPKKIATIWHDLGIETPGELLYACNENRLIHYKGFGEKTQQTILEAVEYYFANQGRFLYAQALSLSKQIEALLNDLFGNKQVHVTGKLARQCEIIDELEYIVVASNELIFEALSMHESWVLKEEDDESFTFKVNNVIEVIIHCCEDEDELSSKLFFTLSSADFIEAFEEKFPDVNYQQASTELDKGIFDEAAISFIEPCLRDNVNSIEKALQGDLPTLIQTQDIRGVIHSHSTWSDGKNSILQMAEACIKKGYEYLVLSDHSVSSFYANGLSIDRIYQQHEEIDTLNRQLKPFKIFKSIECDILNDGRLDYGNDVLATFDLVIAAIHQHLNMTEEKAMMRLMGAIENPFTRILAHPTGRLLLSRKGYPVDFEKLIEACAKNNVVIELNANPRRLDMDWQFLQAAIEAGVMISINPDAHSLDGIDDIFYGVKAAQKGMVSFKNNLSSFTLIEFENFLQRK